MATAEIKRYWARVAELGCVITGNSFCEIHHVRGASISDVGIACGGAQKPSDWLVIPLSYKFHRGEEGFHTLGCKSWEQEYDTQLNYLRHVAKCLDVDVFEKAGFRFDESENRYVRLK